ncbi:transglycosylase domain-containing protein [Naasia sp. SYSU D00948]|uniref:transglycosylase domain-containing protein n=1 Tax=Naasia sp. SYSU D00948 TaxID=2817379 RepID=UPI001B301016|nr:transglycosylase domain-containing protein [Naasia sp. SYSU D00948]
MPSSRIPSKFAALLGFVGMSAAAGVLATAAVTPAIAVSSVAAADTIGIFEELPAYLEIGDLAQRTNIYANNPDGTPYLLAQFYDQNRVEVPWESVSLYAKDALVAGEDPRFYDHGGIDLQGTIRAVINNALGRSVQGGSSITQQYVKNVNIQNFIRDASTQEEIDAAFDKATEVSEARKLREMRYALELEKKYTKDQILLGYLNIVAFGGRVYGVEAASNYYFGVNARDMTLPQAASLMAIVNNPEKFRLDYPDSTTNGAANGYAANKVRRDYILDKMLDEKMITQQEYEAAVAAPVEPRITQPEVGCAGADAGAGFFCDYVTNIFKNNEIFGPDEETRWRNFVRAGYDVYTTLDMELQNAAFSAISDTVPKSWDGVNIGGVAVTVQPGTGRILAMAQNKDYSDDPAVLQNNPNATAVNYNTDREYGGSSGFQPGSTYKVFTLLEWLKQGHGLNEAVDARRRDNWGAFRDSCEGGTVIAERGWNPKNDGGEEGGMWTALVNTVNSYNTGYLAMAKELDLCDIRNTAAALGVHRADGRELEKYPTTVLGTNEIAPLTMAAAYAAIAAGGNYCVPIGIERIVAKDGSDVPIPPITCNQAIDPNVAAGATLALQQAFRAGTGAPSASRINSDVPMFSKTGTTDDAWATWMMGGSSTATTVVGVFNVTGHVNLRNTRLPAGQAATLRHLIWPRIMNVAADKWGGEAFASPSGRVLTGRTYGIPNVVGLSLEEAREKIENAGFEFEDGGQQDSDKPAGTVIGTSPSGSAPAGELVRVFTSNGSLRTVPDAVAGLNTFADSQAALNAAGFAGVQERCVVDANLDGKPVGQDPPPGTAARPDTVITVTVAKPSC